LIGRGAGAEMRRTLGTAVFSGMLGVTIFGIFLTPVFFNVVDWLGSASIFRSRFWRWTRYLSLGVVGGGVVRAAVRYAVQRRQGKVAPAEEDDLEELLEEQSEITDSQAMPTAAHLETAGK
jgi:hypothetical protein